MSRSGYSDECDGLNLYRANVARAIAGRRGQKMLRELLLALDEMPVKELIAHDLENCGQVCALGALGVRRKLDMTELDPGEPDDVAAAFKIARPLACETVYENDESGPHNETPPERWIRMRAWVAAMVRA